MFLAALICLSICLFVKQHYSTRYGWIAMTFYGGSQVVKETTDSILVAIWV